MLASLRFEKVNLQIGFDNVSDFLLTNIHVANHCPHRSFGTAFDFSLTALIFFDVQEKCCLQHRV